MFDFLLQQANIHMWYVYEYVYIWEIRKIWIWTVELWLILVCMSGIVTSGFLRNLCLFISFKKVEG